MTGRTLDRYVFKLGLSRVVYTFTTLVVLFFIFEFAQRIKHYLRYIRENEQSGWLDLVDILTFSLSRLVPVLLEFTALGTLIGCILVIAHLAARNEFVAVKAAGVSMRRFLLPLFAVAFLISAGSFVLTWTAVPWLTRTGHDLEHTILLRPHKFDDALSIQGAETIQGHPCQVVLYVGQFNPKTQTAKGFRAVVVDENGGREHIISPVASWRAGAWHFLPPDSVRPRPRNALETQGRRYRYDKNIFGEPVVGEPVASLPTRLSPNLLFNQRLGPDALSFRELWAVAQRPDLAVVLHRRLAGWLSGLIVLGLGLPLLVSDTSEKPWSRRLISFGVALSYLLTTDLLAQVGSSNAWPAAGSWIPIASVWIPTLGFLALSGCLVYKKMDG